MFDSENNKIGNVPKDATGPFQGRIIHGTVQHISMGVYPPYPPMGCDVSVALQRRCACCQCTPSPYL
jgi:hypothetical protein